MTARLLPWLASIGLVSCASSTEPAPPPASPAPSGTGPTESGLPPCWTTGPEDAANAEWKAFSAVDRMDASLRASVQGHFMHLCWAEDGTCLADTVLVGFFRDILDDFATLAASRMPWQEAGNASLRMGPTEVRQNGISVDAAAFFWGTEERVLGRRYLLDATSGTWTVLDDAETAEDAVYSHHHATIPWLDMEVEWPAGAFEAGTFHQLVLPALTSGVTAGSVSREIRVTPLDSVHWGWESVTDFYGCGAPHGWVQHVGHLFDPRLPLQAGQTVPEPIVADWSSPWSRTALTRMRSLLNAYYMDMADPECGSDEDLRWADSGEVLGGLRLCARPGPGGTVIPTLFNQGDPPMVNRSNGHCTPRLHLDLSEATFEQMAP